MNRKQLQGAMSNTRIWVVLLGGACLVAGCSGEGDSQTNDSPDSSEDFGGASNEDFAGDRDDEAGEGKNDKYSEPGEYTDIKAFTDFYAQSVRFTTYEIHFESAEVQTDTLVLESGTSVEDHRLWLSGNVENRLERTRSFRPGWDLILEDGTRIRGSQDEPTRLDPKATGDFQVYFDLPEDVSLASAQVELQNQRQAGEQRVLRVPLDEEFSSPYPLTIEELVGLQMKTLNPESPTQWKMEILDARVTLDTDYRNGARPEFGMKFIELIIKADLLESSVDDNFWANDFKLVIDGYSVFGKMEGYVLHTNQTATDLLVFEVEDEVTEFEFLYDMGHPADPEDVQQVSVQLPAVME